MPKPLARLLRSEATMPSMMVQSSTMRRLRREFDSRSRLAVAPSGGISKKSSPPHLSSPRKRVQPPFPSGVSSASRSRRDAAPAGGILKKSSAPARSASSTPRERVQATPTPSRPSSAASESISRGAQVRVRTPAGQLPTGQSLVLWLSAVVVSAAEDGFLHVVYKGKFPPDDPFRTVRVARDQVKKMQPADASTASANSTSSSTVTTATAPRPSRDKAAPRPTVSGKSLPALKKLEKEMRSSSEAIMASWQLELGLSTSHQ